MRRAIGDGDACYTFAFLSMHDSFAPVMTCGEFQERRESTSIEEEKTLLSSNAHIVQPFVEAFG